MVGTNGLRTVLIVDDEERLRKALTRSLSHERCRTLAAASASEALDVMSENAIDLVITDLVMPGMDGMGLVRQVKEHHPRTKVIIITAYGSSESMQEAESLGVAGYLAKPFDLAQLKSKMNELLFPGERASCVCGIPQVFGWFFRVTGQAVGFLSGTSRKALLYLKPRRAVERRHS